MFDVIGIGSLNLDLIAAAETIESLPPENVGKAYRIIDGCSGRQAGLREIEEVLSLLGRDSFKESLGGSAFNTVHALAELEAGMKTGFIGVSGSTGSRLGFLDLMRKLDIDSTLVAGEEERCGTCLCVNREGRRSLLIYPGSNSRVSAHILKNRDRILESASAARILHVTSVVGMEPPEELSLLLEEVRTVSPGIMISFDPGLAWVKNINPAITRIMRSSDIIFLNSQEFQILSGAGPESNHAERAGTIFKRFGLEGNLLVAKLKPDIRIYSQSGEGLIERRFENRIVDFRDISDATGAGDMFNAGFLAVLLRRGGASVLEAAELGSRFAFAKLTSSGGNVYSELGRIFREKF